MRSNESSVRTSGLSPSVDENVRKRYLDLVICGCAASAAAAVFIVRIKYYSMPSKGLFIRKTTRTGRRYVDVTVTRS
jgi:2-methylcitrate dehydratase PrpD